MEIFVSLRKDKEKEEKRKKNKETINQFVKSHILGTIETISLKFGVWNTEVGGRVHSKNRLVSLW